MKTIAAIAAVMAATTFMAAQSQAMMLTNRDPMTHRLQVAEAGDEALSHEVFVEAGQSLEGVCPAGCTITLDNGFTETFEGDETVYLEEGNFVIEEDD